MELIRENWILFVIAVLFVFIYFFGYRTRKAHSDKALNHEGNPVKSSTGGTKKSGHGCCH
jgi:hypothetical protein